MNYDIVWLSFSGKNKKRVLNSDDEISLSVKKNKGVIRYIFISLYLSSGHFFLVFIFNDCMTNSSAETLPEV